MDLRIVKKLIALLEESQLSELSFSRENFSISLKKTSNQYHPHPPHTHYTLPPSETSSKSLGTEIPAPMVGTFYHASAPNKPPYVSIGQKISQGDIIGIIEAMKMMNTIESPVSGTVEKICVPNAQGVEFGQALIIVKQD